MGSLNDCALFALSKQANLVLFCLHQTVCVHISCSNVHKVWRQERLC